jgi:alpha,alpha-trehalase
MLDNFVQMVGMFGLVPNGGRIYYQQRSQPPMLIPMVDLYVRATGDVDFLRERINLIEKEFEFWLLNRTVSVQGHTLARYNVEFDGPRPESYRFAIFV